ncbi:MAG: choline dehydrogenase [Gammaproteobacteria bacterium]|nr:choline dehydrogenase [Gammaproteobacteria bacterium]
MPGDREHYDYVVVGAGSAGCIVASRLSGDGSARVLLLEAGPRDDHWNVRMPGGLRAHYALDSPTNWHFSTVPQKHLDARALYQPRGKVLGGSSSINGMVYLRGHPLDYEHWSQQGLSGWSYAHVLPYFKRMERCEAGADAYRGGSGPIAVRRQERLNPLEQAFLAAGREAGFPFTDDVNGATQEGFCRFDMNVDNGVRASASYAYLHKSATGANLSVRVGVLAERLLRDGRRVVGVAYRRNGSMLEAFADREVIVCAGAYGSPQLLMLSGIGPADHLRAHGIRVHTHLPGVGENLHDHLEIHLQHRCTRPLSLNRYMRPHRMALAGLQWMLFKTGVAARNQANVGAFLKSASGVQQPDVQFHFFPVYFNGWHVSAGEFGYRLGSGTMRPSSRGRVRLRSADPCETLDIDPNYLDTEEDRLAMRAAFKLARRTLSQPAFAPYDAGEVDPGAEVEDDGDIDAYVRRAAGSAYHPVGTCKMGPETDALAVTDAEARVRGVEGLRVVDASIMPSIASSNLNAVVMMMAEKLCDAIAGRTPLPRLEVPFDEAR